MDVKQLCERYQLISRQGLYDRLKALNITLDRQGNKSFATPQQIELLDQLQKHLTEGGSLKTFTPTVETTVTVETVSSELDTSPDTVRSRLDSSLDTVSSELDINPQTLALLSLLQANNRRSPLDKHRELQEATVNEWILSSSEIEELLGVKPKGETFTRGCWVFTKAGKVGGQNGWLVSKL